MSTFVCYVCNSEGSLSTVAASLASAGKYGNLSNDWLDFTYASRQWVPPSSDSPPPLNPHICTVPSPMVGTPQHPLKYRRKGDADYRVYNPDVDMSLDSSTSSLNARRFGSECSMPRSPTLYYSASSSNAPSSPIRSLCTPEPPSSPLTEPYVGSGPKSPELDGRKGFWEVAFNYSPGFPHKSRPTVHTHDFSCGQFRTRRRSSSASAPALVSDVDPSEYSEDNDPFRMDDDTAVECGGLGSVAIVGLKGEPTFSGPFHRDEAIERNSGRILDGEIDVAAVLLDLHRQVRVTQVESKAVDVAIKPSSSLCSDSLRHDHHVYLAMVPPSKVPSQADGELSSFTFVSSETQDCSVSHESFQDFELSNLGEHKSHEQRIHSAEGESLSEHSQSVNGAPVDAIEAQVSTSAEAQRPGTSHGISVDASISSDNIALGNVELAAASMPLDETRSKNGDKSPADVVQQMLDVDPIIELIFSNSLTPISSPALSSCEIADFSEPLSELSSPNIDVFEPTGPLESAEMRHPEGSEDLDRFSPVAGPSNRRFGSVDQHAALANHKDSQSLKGCREARPDRSLSGMNTRVSERVDAKKSGKKRVRSSSAIESRPSSPSPASCSDIPKPRQKRSKKSARGASAPRIEDETMLANVAQSSHTASTLPAHGSLSLPRDMQSDAGLPAVPESDDSDARAEMCGCLIQAMVLSRASSKPASSLLRDVLRENPHLTDQRSRENWLSLVQLVLESHDVFGRIDREGLDADDKPLEAQWFYVPENDPDQDRASLLREMMPPKRNETKKHKQYFYKPLGKITRWHSEDSP